MCQVPGQEGWIIFGITSGGFNCGNPETPPIFT